MTADGEGRTTDWVELLTRASACFLLIFVVDALTLRDSTAGDPLFGPITAWSLLHEGDLDLDEYPSSQLLDHPLVLEHSDRAPETAFLDSPTLDGVRAQPRVHVYDYFPWSTSLFALPAAAIASVTVDTDGGPLPPDDPTLGRLHILTASLLVTLAAMLLRGATMLVVDGSERRRRLAGTGAALVFAFGTSAWSTASRALSQHTPSLVFVSLLVYLAVSFQAGAGRPVDRWSPRLGGAVFGAATAASAIVRPPNLWLGAALLLWLVVRDPARRIAAVVAAAVTGGAFLLANLALLGTLVQPYYSGTRFSLHDEMFEAIAANWVSPSRGLLVASPVVAVAVVGAVRWWRDRRRALVTALVVPIGALTISVSGLADNWWAGASIGPRFMTDALPQLVVLAAAGVDVVLRSDRAPARRRAALVVVGALVVWSVGYHAIGANSSAAACWTVDPTYIDDDPARVWSITDSQMGRPLGMILHGDVAEAIDQTC